MVSGGIVVDTCDTLMRERCFFLLKTQTVYFHSSNKQDIDCDDVLNISCEGEEENHTTADAHQQAKIYTSNIPLNAASFPFLKSAGSRFEEILNEELLPLMVTEMTLYAKQKQKLACNHLGRDLCFLVASVIVARAHSKASSKMVSITDKVLPHTNSLGASHEWQPVPANHEDAPFYAQ